MRYTFAFLFYVLSIILAAWVFKLAHVPDNSGTHFLLGVIGGFTGAQGYYVGKWVDKKY